MFLIPLGALALSATTYTHTHTSAPIYTPPETQPFLVANTFVQKYHSFLHSSTRAGIFNGLTRSVTTCAAFKVSATGISIPVTGQVNVTWVLLPLCVLPCTCNAHGNSGYHDVDKNMFYSKQPLPHSYEIEKGVALLHI